MSRLLFAAARGARVQRQQESLSGTIWWETVAIQWGLDEELRIRPDDEHLQYGPISTALRGMAINNQKPTESLYTVSGAITDWARDDKHSMRYDTIELHRSLFLLILAEALADEGL